MKKIYLKQVRKLWSRMVISTGSGTQLKMLFLFIIVLTAVQAHAVPKETVVNLVDQDRVLIAPIELHITATTNPFTNSTVSLNHEDAWLFFDNIRPADVVANYLGNVLVSGQPFNNGGNGRVAIYAHGTVLMPHPASYQPLTVYTEENFGGESASYTLHTYHNALGNFNNAIRSFKLKRGYQATFATSSNGRGYSRVFIADTEDVEIDVMPDLLKGTVSFIRVFKHQWVTKKGWAGWSASDIQRTDVTWYYDWNIGGATSNNSEYVAIRQHGGWPSWNDINSKQHISHLMGFNEPDRPDQANMTFDAALAQWPDFMNSGLRLGSPATSDPFNQWSLFRFIDRCNELDYRVDFVVMHAYWGGKSAQQWYNDLRYIHERTGRPLWIKEWNNGANWTTEWWPDAWEAKLQKQLNDLTGILNVLDTASFVERYSIYSWVQEHRQIFLNNGDFSPAGQYYANNKSRIAFNKAKEVIPTWKYRTPTIAYQYLTLSNRISLTWTDANGDLSKGYRIEKKIGNGAYEVIYESTDNSILNYADDVLDGVSGRITYRVSVRTVNDEYITSNEVSYFQSAGQEHVQAGKYPVNNTDWSRSVFSKRYSATPMVVLGIPTFNNIVAMSNRVNSVSTSSFMFRFYPWMYLNNPTLLNTDDIAVMALPVGVYDFGGLKALSTSVAGVNGNWMEVQFAEEFATIPAIFCTQVTNSNNFTTAIGVRNVTTTGFEVRLVKEEALGGSFLGERINYLAVEPGQGSIEGKRITVGTTVGETGISNQPVVVPFDATYTQPAVFAGLMSMANTFGVTLRHYFSTTNSSVTILKHRELSGALVMINQDILGWMIMDLAPGQPVSINTIRKPLVSVFPNPVSDILYFNSDKPVKVAVTDIYGRTHIEIVTENSVDVRFLPFGMYILQVEGREPVKFMKK